MTQWSFGVQIYQFISREQTCFPTFVCKLGFIIIYLKISVSANSWYCLKTVLHCMHNLYNPSWTLQATCTWFSSKHGPTIILSFRFSLEVMRMCTRTYALFSAYNGLWSCFLCQWRSHRCSSVLLSYHARLIGKQLLCLLATSTCYKNYCSIKMVAGY